MGTTTCRNCSLTTFFDKSSELDLKVEIVSEVKSFPVAKNYESLEKVLPKLKALWTGYSTRKLYFHLLRQARPGHRYFSKAEITETLSGKFLGNKKYATHSYKQGGVYVGEWIGGFRHGYGAMIWPDNAKYEGNWVFGRPSGYGKFMHIDSEAYYGAWVVYWVFPKDLFTSGGNLEKLKNSASDGFLWLHAKSEMFKIDPPENRKNHKKTAQIPISEKVQNAKAKSDQIFKKFLEIKTSFNLLYEDKIKNQAAEIVLENKGKYIGECDNGKRHGFGTMVWPNGDVYEGSWQADRMNGVGKHTWTSGNFYLGEFENDLKEGLGEYHWKDGSFYVGEWSRNKMHGIGKHTWDDGKEYIGEWANGGREGAGILLEKNGSKYEGLFLADRQNGLGTMTEATGKVLKGFWENGKYKEPFYG